MCASSPLFQYIALSELYEPYILQYVWRTVWGLPKELGGRIAHAHSFSGLFHQITQEKENFCIRRLKTLE
jgi:hypothetical protein